MCHSIYRYAKANNKYMKKYEKKRIVRYSILGCKILYGQAMPQKLPAKRFEWIKDTSQFNEDSIKNYNGESDEVYFTETDVQYLEKLHELHQNENWKSRKVCS